MVARGDTIPMLRVRVPPYRLPFLREAASSWGGFIQKRNIEMTVTVRYMSASFPEAWRKKEKEMTATLASLVNDLANLSQADQQIMLVILIGSLMEDFDEYGVQDFIRQFSEALREYTEGRRSERVAHGHVATSQPN